MKEIGIVGSSAFAREVADIAFELGYRPIYVVRDDSEVDAADAASEFILESQVVDYPSMLFVIGIGGNQARQSVAERLAGRVRFTNLIHPSASFGRNQKAAVEKSIGVIICAGARLTNGITIGDFVVVNLNATIGHDCEVSDYVNIAPGVNVSGNVSIGARCWIGTGATIIQGSVHRKLVVGADTSIGAGAVAIGDCEPNSTYVGVPARKVK